MSEWISVKDRLPDVEGYFLVARKGYFPAFVSGYSIYSSGRTEWSQDEYGNSEPTHWMPLPEPPK